MKRISWTALPVLLALAPASNAQSVGYEEALRAATSDQPQTPGARSPTLPMNCQTRAYARASRTCR
jgi:hypothetical protein